MTDQQTSEVLQLLADIRKNQLESIALQQESLVHVREVWDSSKRFQEVCLKRQKRVTLIALALGIVAIGLILLSSFLKASA